MPTAQRSLLIIHPGGLGDVLLAYPAMASLRRRHPTSRVILLSGAEVGSLLHACRVADCTLTTESGDLASLMGGAEQIPNRLRDVLQRCEQAIGWINDHDGSLRTTLQQLNIRKIILESPVPRPGRHHSLRFLDVFTRADHSHTPAVPLIVPEDLRQAGAQALREMGIQDGQDFVLCHTGSGSLHKVVRPAIISEVLQQFRRSGIMPVMAAGPADDVMIDRLKKFDLTDVPLIQRRRLTTLAGIMARARLYVGHDSGVTHLAAALQVPTVAIFGPTDPLQWAPLGDHVTVVPGPACGCSGWEMVRACEEKPCLAIKPEEILAAAFSVLDRYPRVTES